MARLLVTQDQLNLLDAKLEASKGTSEYYHWTMQSEYKDSRENATWKFTGYSIPYHKAGENVYFKRIKDKLYIYVDLGFEMNRYLVDFDIQKLLGVEAI